MSVIPWILIAILVLVLLLLIIAVFVTRKTKRPIDYYNFFIMGIIWCIIGIPFKNSTLWILGLAFMAIGLVNKKKWRKNRLTWKKLTKQEKQIRLFLIIFLVLLALIGIIALYLVEKGIF